MEKQGIIAGIGDLGLDINVITPKIDADVNKYILNKNAIIQGLTITGNTLYAGICVLCGFRGKLTEDINPIGTNEYIYGKFILNFDNNIADEFYIETTNTVKTGTNVNPTSIDAAGIYYLLLYVYENGAYIVNPALYYTHKYPQNAFEAEQSNFLLAGGTISSSATTETPSSTNAHETQPLRVANTQYVHNQIDKEIDYDKIDNIQITTTYSGSIGAIGYATISKKAKYVKVIGVGRAEYDTINSDCNITIPEGYRPKENGAVLVFPSRGNVSTGAIYHVYLTILEINTNGTVTATNRIDKFSGTKQQAEEYIANLQYISGWETN